MTPQQRMIFSYLRRHGSITPMEALGHCHSYRLAARIHELRNLGVRINTQLIRTKTRERVARYVYMGGPKDGKH